MSKTKILYSCLCSYLERPVPQDVYKRLSDLEKRILHLEGLSPEYFRKNVSTRWVSERGFRLNFHQDPGILWQWVQYFLTNLWFLYLSPYISSARKHSFSWSPTPFLLPLLWSDHVTEGREKENLKETRTSGVRSLKRHKKFSLVSRSWQYPKKNHLSLFLQVILHCWLRALKLAFFGCNISAWQRERWNHFFWGRIVLWFYSGNILIFTFHCQIKYK